MNLEQKINYQLNKYPNLKKNIKSIYQRTMYAISPKIRSEGDIVRISPDDQNHEYFFGYYDKSPWDISDRYMLCMRAKNTWSDVSPKEKADILLIDTTLPETDQDRVKKIAETSTWNVQQGCMAQWLGPDFSSAFIFNDYRHKKYVSIIKDIKIGTERVIPAPIYAVSLDGKIALTLNFSRLYNLRPGYGYYNVPEQTKGIALPDTTAVWKIDLITGDVQPLLTYKDFAEFEPRPEMQEAGAVHKVNHLMISPSGKRSMVLYRWFVGQRKYTRLITFDTFDGKNMYVLSDDDMVSHCFWKDNEHILAFENKKKGGPGYYFMKDKTREYTRCWPELTRDGHPSYSPDRDYIVIDTYPDRKRIQTLYVIRGEKGKPETVAKVYAPFKYDNDTRCDLHPRWNHFSDSIAFDSTFEGRRGLYSVKIKNDLPSQISMPLISVVIPTHNRSTELVRAIESVRNQTYKNLEIIVVSDGSVDDTDEVMRKMSLIDERIRYIEYSPAKGANVARNTGIKSAGGEFIAFLDDDDEWKEEKIKKQLDLMFKNPNIGIIYTGADVLYKDLNIKYKSRAKNEGDLSLIILFENCIGSTSSVMIKKNLIDEVGDFDENLPALQDFEMWIRACQKTNVGVVNESMIIYNNELDKRQISASTEKYVKAFEYINIKHKTLFNSMSVSQQIEKRNNEYYLLANKALRNGDKKLGRKYIKNILYNKIEVKALIYFAMSFLDYKYLLILRQHI